MGRERKFVANNGSRWSLLLEQGEDAGLAFPTIEEAPGVPRSRLVVEFVNIIPGWEHARREIEPQVVEELPMQRPIELECHRRSVAPEKPGRKPQQDGRRQHDCRDELQQVG